jgi:hypothetical protein
MIAAFENCSPCSLIAPGALSDRAPMRGGRFVLGFIGDAAPLLRSLDEPAPLVAAVSVLKFPLDAATFEGLLDTPMRLTDVCYGPHRGPH